MVLLFQNTFERKPIQIDAKHNYVYKIFVVRFSEAKITYDLIVDVSYCNIKRCVLRDSCSKHEKRPILVIFDSFTFVFGEFFHSAV